MTLSRTDAQTVLEMLGDIRRIQSKTIERMSNDSYWLLRLENEIDDLATATSKLCSAVPSDPAGPEPTGLRRDVTEFRADVTALKGYFAEVCLIATDAQADMANIKAKLDVLQTCFEQSDI